MTTKLKFDPRKMMEKAIESMKQSIHERRDDGKTSPQVGAVLVKPDGTWDTAFRGELRHGDHAEFTLLERKLRDARLDGSVVFSTLEPCAPGARKHPKLSCAERIVNARVSEVWVGIEDPDPTVDRQGIRFLENNGIKIHLFDRDLQDEIRAVNKEFITQALERGSATHQKKAQQPVPLSIWDEVLPGAELEDLSNQALSRYRERTKIPEKVGSVGFLDRLQRQGLLRRHGKNLRPTGFGLMLFGKNPREVIHHAGLNLTIEYADGKNEIENFDGPALLIPDAIEKWLKPKLPNVLDRSKMARGHKEAVPFELVREAVINALVHRDYDLIGATCHLFVSPDVVKVRSPGEPLPPVTTEQLQGFTAPMYNRNPKLQFAFGGSKLVEGRGFGMRTFGQAAENHGIPVPKYDFDGLYLNLTLLLHTRAAVKELTNEIFRKLNEDEIGAWQFIVTREFITTPELMEQTGFSGRKTQRVLKKLLDLKLLKRLGKGPSTRYKRLGP